MVLTYTVLYFYLSSLLTLGQSWDICVGYFFHKSNYFCEAIRLQSHRSHHLFQAVNDLIPCISCIQRRPLHECSVHHCGDSEWLCTAMKGHQRYKTAIYRQNLEMFMCRKRKLLKYFSLQNIFPQNNRCVKVEMWLLGCFNRVIFSFERFTRISDLGFHKVPCSLLYFSSGFQKQLQ